VNTWTPELEAMYGLPPGGFGGTQTVFENLVHPDDRAGVIKLVDAAMKSGQPTKGEWRVVWVTGAFIGSQGAWQVFRDASGELQDDRRQHRYNGAQAGRRGAARERGVVNFGGPSRRMYAFEWDATQM